MCTGQYRDSTWVHAGTHVIFVWPPFANCGLAPPLLYARFSFKSSTSVDFPLEWPAALQNLARRARDAL